MRPKLLFLIGIVSLVGWMLWPTKDNRHALRPPIMAVNTLQPCIELRPANQMQQDAVVDKPGQYCVARDFWQLRLHGAGHSWPGISHHLIEIEASNVTIDLRNHILHSDGHSTGIGVSLDELNWVKTRTITIKNGVIDLRGVGSAVASHHRWQMFSLDEPAPHGLTGYEEPRLILENLLIKTDNVGITLTGDGNIIRNCIIESGGDAAIIMAGPNGHILNNKIVLTNPFVPGSMKGANFSQPGEILEIFKYRKVPMAAIALHQATGTLIRGNRIEVKGKSATRHNIYLIHGSKNVRIEGNTIVGAEDPVTLLDGSTAALKNNVFEQRKPWWKF